MEIVSDFITTMSRYINNSFNHCLSANIRWLKPTKFLLTKSVYLVLLTNSRTIIHSGHLYIKDNSSKDKMYSEVKILNKSFRTEKNKVIILLCGPFFFETSCSMIFRLDT